MTDPSSPPARAVAGPLILALVFLAIIGASVGVTIGLTRNNGTNSSGGTTTATDPTTPGRATTPADPSAAAPAATSAPPPAPAPAGKRCLAHTEKQAGGRALTQVLYLQARRQTPDGERRIEVWICRDAAGRLYYQGHEGPPEDRELVEGVDALFLRTVTEQPYGYQAVNSNGRSQTTYDVSTEKVIINGTTEFTVTYHEP